MKVKALVARSYPILCDPMDCNPPLSVHGIFQARILEYSLLQGIFLTQGSNPGLLHCRQILYYLSHQGSPIFSPYTYSYCRLLLLLLSRFSRVWLLATPRTATHQAPPSMGFSRQEYWSGCHCLLHRWLNLCYMFAFISDFFPLIICFILLGLVFVFSS